MEKHVLLFQQVGSRWNDEEDIAYRVGTENNISWTNFYLRLAKDLIES
ncbi:hypothetical protein [Haliscomenobacter sp.]